MIEIDDFGRPNWDSYFLSLALLVSQRSIDPHTKVGCVVINSEKSILTTGYNGPPRGMNDKELDLTRPAKYLTMAHAEMNSIANAARHGICLRNSIFYTTHSPCEVCFRSIINCGAKKVITLNLKTSMANDLSNSIIEKMSKETGVQIINAEFDLMPIFENLLKSYKEKLNGQT